MLTSGFPDDVPPVPPSPSLTPQQAKLLRYIAEFRRTEGVSPSHPEMCRALGLATSNNAGPYLRPLIAHGLVRGAKNNPLLAKKRVTTVARGYFPTEAGIEWIRQSDLFERGSTQPNLDLRGGQQ